MTVIRDFIPIDGFGLKLSTLSWTANRYQVCPCHVVMCYFT